MTELADELELISDDNTEVDVAALAALDDRLRAFSANFFGDTKALAKQYVEYFFQDKMCHCGGPIPRSMLLTDRRLSMVINYDILRAVERSYKHLEPLLDEEEVLAARKTGEVTSDIRLVNSTLSLLAQSGIPQQFAGGMLLLYLEFVEGVAIGTEP